MPTFPATGESPASFEARILASSRQHVVTVDGAKTVWRTWGDESHPPLVLLHGGYGSWRHFAVNVLDLSRRRWVLLPDSPGLGDSDVQKGEYSAAAIAATLAQGIDEQIGHERAYDICGFSLGGIFGGHIAALQSPRIKTLVIIGTGGFGDPLPQLPKLANLKIHMSATELAELHRINLGRLMLFNPERVDDLAVYLQTENVRRSRTRRKDLAKTNILLKPLGAAKTRLVGIFGAQDPYTLGVLPQRQAILEQLNPNTSFFVIKNAAHWVMYDTPDAFHQTLSQVITL